MTNMQSESYSQKSHAPQRSEASLTTTKPSEYDPHHVKFNPKDGKALAAHCIPESSLNTPPLMECSAAYKKNRLSISKLRKNLSADSPSTQSITPPTLRDSTPSSGPII